MDSELRKKQRNIFTALWLTYASYYLCRVNLSASVPAIMDATGFGEKELGQVGAVFLFVYSFGQLINGQLGDRFGARILAPLGMAGSAFVNFLFGFSGSLHKMMILWGVNGYFQSMGWGVMVKTLANWFPPRLRGTVSGLFGSSYKIGNIAGWLLAGFIAELLDWRYAFWVPAGLVFLSALNSLLKIRNAPEQIGLPSVEEQAGTTSTGTNDDEHLGFGFTLRRTFGNPLVWVAGFATTSLSVVVYGLLFWTPTYINKVYGLKLSGAVSGSVILPASGISGLMFCGWLSDRLFGGRRAPVVSLGALLVAIIIFVFFVPSGRVGSWPLALLLLGVVGFIAFGSHGLIVTVIAMEFGSRKAAASSAGFLNSFGYLGGCLSVGAVGYIVSATGWNGAFLLWAGASALSAMLIGALWRFKPTDTTHL